MHPDTRRISQRTPLRDHAGVTIGFYPPDKIRALILRTDVIVIGTRKRITAVAFLGPDPAGLLSAGSQRRRPVGSPHTHENYYNVRGSWHIDRIPPTLYRCFRQVVEDCIVGEEEEDCSSEQTELG